MEEQKISLDIGLDYLFFFLGLEVVRFSLFFFVGKKVVADAFADLAA